MKELLEVFKTGSTVSTRQKDQTGWISNSILDNDLDGQIIEISLKQEYIDELLMKDDAIEIRLALDGFLYVAKGAVKDITTSFPQRVIVQVSSIDKFEDKRDEVRYDIHLSSMVKGPEIASPETSIITNISRSGLGMVSKQNLSLETEIFIDIFFDDGTVLKLKGTPVRKKALGYNIEYGVSITPIDENNREIFEQFLDDLEIKDRSSMSIVKKIRSKNINTAD